MWNITGEEMEVTKEKHGRARGNGKVQRRMTEVLRKGEAVQDRAGGA